MSVREQIEAMNDQINDLKRALDVITQRNAELMFERDQIAARRAELVEKHEFLREHLQKEPLGAEIDFLRTRGDFWQEQTNQLRRQLRELKPK